MKKKLVFGLLTLVALGGLGLYAWLHREEVSSLVLVSPFALVLCAGAILASLVLVGPLFYLMINRLRRCVGLVECLALSVVTTAVNTLVPLQGGAGVRAVYLKHRHGFQYSSFLATLYGYQILRILACAAGAGGAVLWMVWGEGRPGLAPLLAGVLLCLGASLAACYLPRVRANGRWLVDRLAAFTQGWHLLRARPRFLAAMALLVTAQLAAEVLAFWAACAALGVRLSAADAVVVGTLGTLATVLSLTPNGLGLFEATAAFVSSAVTLNPVHSVMAALLSRVVLLGLLLAATPLGVVYLGWGWKQPAPASPSSASPGERVLALSSVDEGL